MVRLASEKELHMMRTNLHKSSGVLLFLVLCFCFAISSCSKQKEYSCAPSNSVNTKRESSNETLAVDSHAFFRWSSFKDLPLSESHITIQSLLADIYSRDSTRIIDDFQIYLNPELYQKTGLNKIPVNPFNDTIYFRSVYENGDYHGTSFAQIWNSEKAIHSCVLPPNYNYEWKLNIPTWEQRLIESWNMDSIERLTNPTFYNITCTNHIKNYLFQIVIANGKAKSRYMIYSRLYLPNELANDSIEKRKYNIR